MGERRDVCRVLVGKPEGKRSLGRHRRRWEDNIKMGLQVVGVELWTRMSCSGSGQVVALVNAVMNNLVP
jgi:hypothetical protein